MTDTQRILIVDDDPSCRAMLDNAFEQHGFQVTHTDSVLGASELIARVQPTVILLDLALPYRSGASWLAQLKANPATADIPVVIVSAFTDVIPRERQGLAQAIVRKPYRAQTLVRTVQAVCAGEHLIEAEMNADLTTDPGNSRRRGLP